MSFLLSVAAAAGFENGDVSAQVVEDENNPGTWTVSSLFHGTSSAIDGLQSDYADGTFQTNLESGLASSSVFNTATIEICNSTVFIGKRSKNCKKYVFSFSTT